MDKSKMKSYLTFILIWAAYAGCYLLRKPFGIIKVSIQETMSLSETKLGYIDLAFNLPYALVSLCFGGIGDIIGPKIILGGGLIGSALASCSMGIYDNYIVLLSLIFVLGIFQSLTWPASCDILSTWFPKDALTSMMGLFGTSLLVGGIASAALTITTAELYGWQNVFYIPSGIVLTIGIMVLALVRKGPENKITSFLDPEKLPEKNVTSLPSEGRGKWTSLIHKIITQTIVPHASIMLFCIKGIRNAMLFWLPYYLMHVFGYSQGEAGYISLLFEVGGLASVPFTIFIDKCMKQNDLLAISIFNFLLVAANLVLLLENKFGNYFLYASILLSGALSSSSEITLCGSMATKLGTQLNARSVIIGMINGIGSLGSVVEGPVLSYLLYWFGPNSLIYFIIVFSAISAITSIHALFIQKKHTKIGINE